MTTMLRVSPETRDRINRLAAAEFGGASADETVARLLDEHLERAAIDAMDRYRAEDPEGWSEYLADARRAETLDAGVSDGWDEGA